MPNITPCPCGNPNFQQCCAPYLAHAALPPTAEALMRSRYSAYTLGDESYLLASWHASTRPAGRIIEQEEKLVWLGLEVKSDLRLRKRKPAGTAASAPPVTAASVAMMQGERQNDRQEEGDKRQWATVEFVARYKINGRAHRLHEISRFVCEQEAAGPRWYYVDGSFPDR